MKVPQTLGGRLQLDGAPSVSPPAGGCGRGRDAAHARGHQGYTEGPVEPFYVFSGLIYTYVGDHGCKHVKVINSSF